MINNLLTDITHGAVLPGDAVHFEYRKRSLTQLLIGRVSKRALEDIGLPTDAHRYTHTAMVRDEVSCIEMTSPECREVTWGERFDNVRSIRVTRPKLADSLALQRALAMMQELIGSDYPESKILMYWAWSWPLKLWRSTRVKDSFRKTFGHSSHVCSGSVWACWIKSGAVWAEGADAWPASWYPARMATETDRIELVAEYNEP